jgi:hypothetical protein
VILVPLRNPQTIVLVSFQHLHYHPLQTDACYLSQRKT